MRRGGLAVAGTVLMGSSQMVVTGVASAVGSSRRAPAGGDEFGSSVAISGSTAVVGAMQVDSQQGAAYVLGRA